MNEEAARLVLIQMGVPDDTELSEALLATEDVLAAFRLSNGTSTDWEAAAELVGAFFAVTGITGAGLRQVRTIAHAAYKLKRQ